MEHLVELRLSLTNKLSGLQPQHRFNDVGGYWLVLVLWLRSATSTR